VLAAPFVAKKKVVVPVLLDQKSAKRAKLRVPAGVLMLKKGKKVKVAGQRARVAPALLRVGDRFRARSKVNRAAARAYYWRIGAKKFTLTKRSATLSPAEMIALLGGLGKDVARLDAALTSLATYVQMGFDKENADFAGVQSQLGALATALAALDKRVAAMEAGLPGMEARLQQQIDDLSGDLAALKTQVGTLETQLGALQTQVGTLQTSLTSLQNEVDTLSGDVSTLKTQMATVQSGLAALQTSVSSLQTAVTGLQGSINAICGEAIITVC